MYFLLYINGVFLAKHILLVNNSMYNNIGSNGDTSFKFYEFTMLSSLLKVLHNVEINDLDIDELLTIFCKRVSDFYKARMYNRTKIIDILAFASTINYSILRSGTEKNYKSHIREENTNDKKIKFQEIYFFVNALTTYFINHAADFKISHVRLLHFNIYCYNIQNMMAVSTLKQILYRSRDKKEYIKDGVLLISKYYFQSKNILGDLNELKVLTQDNMKIHIILINLQFFHLQLINSILEKDTFNFKLFIDVLEKLFRNMIILNCKSKGKNRSIYFVNNVFKEEHSFFLKYYVDTFLNANEIFSIINEITCVCNIIALLPKNKNKDDMEDLVESSRVGNQKTICYEKILAILVRNGYNTVTNDKLESINNVNNPLEHAIERIEVKEIKKKNRKKSKKARSQILFSKNDNENLNNNTEQSEDDEPKKCNLRNVTRKKSKVDTQNTDDDFKANIRESGEDIAEKLSTKEKTNNLTRLMLKTHMQI